MQPVFRSVLIHFAILCHRKAVMKSPYAKELEGREARLDRAAELAAYQLLSSICDVVEAEAEFSKSVGRLGEVRFTSQFFASNLMTRIRERLVLSMLNCGTDFESAVLCAARSIHPYSSSIVPTSDMNVPASYPHMSKDGFPGYPAE